MEKTLYAYNNCASAYEEKFSKNKTYKKHALLFADHFEEGASILDAGCGPGLNSALFAGRKLSVTGIDYSEEMIKLAEKNCPEGDFIHVRFEEFETDNKFDGICLSFVIVHMENEKAESLINRVSSLIKNGGRVYISFMTGKKPGYEHTSFAEDEIYFNYFEKEYIISLFNNNGFELISSHTDPYEEADGSFTDDIFLIFEKKD